MVIAACAGLGATGGGLLLISHKRGCFRERVGFRAVGWVFSIPQGKKRGQKLEKPQHRNAESGAAARSAAAAVPMGGETGEGNALGRMPPPMGAVGGQDHGGLGPGAGRDPVVGWMAAAEHLSGGISHRSCWRLLCPVPAPQPACGPVRGKSPFLPPQLLGLLFFFSSFFGENNA